MPSQLSNNIVSLLTEIDFKIQTLQSAISKCYLIALLYMQRAGKGIYWKIIMIQATVKKRRQCRYIEKGMHFRNCFKFRIVGFRFIIIRFLNTAD